MYECMNISIRVYIYMCILINTHIYVSLFDVTCRIPTHIQSRQLFFSLVKSGVQELWTKLTTSCADATIAALCSFFNLRVFIKE